MNELFFNSEEENYLKLHSIKHEWKFRKFIPHINPTNSTEGQLYAKHQHETK